MQSFFGSKTLRAFLSPDRRTTFLRILYNDDRNNLIYLKQFVCHLLPKHSLSGLNFAGPGEVEGQMIPEYYYFFSLKKGNNKITATKS